MAKVNKELRSKLVFKTERRKSDRMSGEQVIVSTTYEDIYRQYSYHDNGDNDEEDLMLIDLEARNIITHAIEKELIKQGKQ